MFSLINIQQYITIPPEFLGPNLKNYINSKLILYQGSCTIKYGYIVSIFKIEKIEYGIVNDNGEAIYLVIFKALVCKPLKGEIIDARVEGIERVGIELKYGKIKIFIPHTVILLEIV